MSSRAVRSLPSRRAWSRQRCGPDSVRAEAGTRPVRGVLDAASLVIGWIQDELLYGAFFVRELLGAQGDGADAGPLEPEPGGSWRNTGEVVLPSGSLEPYDSRFITVVNETIGLYSIRDPRTAADGRA